MKETTKLMGAGFICVVSSTGFGIIVSADLPYGKQFGITERQTLGLLALLEPIAVLQHLFWVHYRIKPRAVNRCDHPAWSEFLHFLFYPFAEARSLIILFAADPGWHYRKHISVAQAMVFSENMAVGRGVGGIGFGFLVLYWSDRLSVVFFEE